MTPKTNQIAIIVVIIFIISFIAGQGKSVEPTAKPPRAPDPTEPADPTDPCSTFSEAAELIMRARQSGASMTRTLQATDGQTMLEAMVVVAYSLPRRDSTEGQRQQTAEFREAAYTGCLRSSPQEYTWDQIKKIQ